MNKIIKNIFIFIICVGFLFSCTEDERIIGSPLYRLAFLEDSRLLAEKWVGGRGSGEPLRLSVEEIDPDTNERMVLTELPYYTSFPASSVCYGEGRFWYNLCNTLFSCTLEGDDLRMELQKEDVWRLTPIKIQKGRLLLLYTQKAPDRYGEWDDSFSYSAFEPETGTENHLYGPSTQLDIYSPTDWDGEQLLFSIRGGGGGDTAYQLLYRFGPEGRTVLAAYQGQHSGWSSALAADGTAYWLDPKQSAIYWQKKGEEPQSAIFSVVSGLMQICPLDDGRVMLAAPAPQGLSLYCFTPEDGRMDVIFANIHSWCWGTSISRYLLFDEENYYYFDLSDGEVKKRSLKPLYQLSE